MNNINILPGLIVSNQKPLDGKIYFLTLADLIDLGENNYKAFIYYEGMRVFCLETKSVYIWEEAPANETGIITPNYTYPSGASSNGINYGNRNFNFFLYSESIKNIINNLPDFGDLNIANQAIDYGVIYRPDLGDLTYQIWATKYRIKNVVYENQPINEIVEINVGDSNNPRFDLFVIFNDGQGVFGGKIIEGTPDVNPEVPQLENDIQAEVGLKLMNPNQTTDLEYSRETVWNENLGHSNEWLFGSGNNASVIVSAENAFIGTHFIRFGGIIGVVKSFTLKRENLKEFNVENNLVIGIKNLSGSFNTGERIQIRLTNISSPVRIVPAILDITAENANSFNLDPSSDQWQYAYIPFRLLNYEGIKYDLITIDSNLNSELWIDDVHIETGLATTFPQNNNADYRLSKLNGNINLLKNNSIVASVKISEVEIAVGSLNQTTISFQENTDYIANNIDLFIDGVLQIPGSDYNYLNNEIVLSEALVGPSNIYIRKF